MSFDRKDSKYSWNTHSGISIYILRYQIYFWLKENTLTPIYSYLDVAIESQQGRNKGLLAKNKNK